MSTLRFNLRTDKPDKQFRCPLELVYQISGQRKYYQIRDIKLNQINWDSGNQISVYKVISKAKKEIDPKYHNQADSIFLLASEVEAINETINQIRKVIRDIERRFELDMIPYTASMVVDALKLSISPKTRKEEPKEWLFDFIDKYIKDHEATREPGSLSVYKTVKNHLLAYQNETKHKVRFETIDYAFFQRFQNFLIHRKKVDREGNIAPQLNNTTIAKALSTLKTFLGYARQNGIKINDSYRDFKIKRERMEVIALTEGEFQRLLDFDLTKSKRLDQVRDVFCFSCASGLRVSDMQQLRWEHIKRDEIVLVVKKTKSELAIPLNSITSGILMKYKDQLKPLPIISSQKLNVYIKELCMIANIDEPIEIVRFRGSKRESTIYPKYQLIHLHTGRKTFCTLSLEKGMSAEQVMSISGHSDYKSFKRYVSVTEKLKKTVMAKAWGPANVLKAV